MNNKRVADVLGLFAGREHRIAIACSTLSASLSSNRVHALVESLLEEAGTIAIGTTASGENEADCDDKGHSEQTNGLGIDSKHGRTPF